MSASLRVSSLHPACQSVWDTRLSAAWPPVLMGSLKECGNRRGQVWHTLRRPDIMSFLPLDNMGWKLNLLEVTRSHSGEQRTITGVGL